VDQPQDGSQPTTDIAIYVPILSERKEVSTQQRCLCKLEERKKGNVDDLWPVGSEKDGRLAKTERRLRQQAPDGPKEPNAACHPIQRRKFISFGMTR
jgi:hypothetical protein